MENGKLLNNKRKIEKRGEKREEKRGKKREKREEISLSGQIFRLRRNN